MIINKDINLSYRDYKQFNGSLLITSIFETIQGEGPFAGHPALFIRLAGCNIGAKDLCTFCDTKFTFSEGKAYTPTDLFDAVAGYLEGPRRLKLIVITGGEPLLQQDALASFYKLLNTKLAEVPTVQIETNGMLIDDETDPFPYYVVSPKSTPTNYARLNWEAIGMLKHCFKYVVEAEPTSMYHSIPENHLEEIRVYCRSEVYVSAMCVYIRTPAAGEIPNIWDPTLVCIGSTARNYQHAAAYALRERLTLSYQTHLFAKLA